MDGDFLADVWSIFFVGGEGMKPLDNQQQRNKKSIWKPGRFVGFFGITEIVPNLAGPLRFKKTPEFQDVLCKKDPGILDGPGWTFA